MRALRGVLGTAALGSVRLFVFAQERSSLGEIVERDDAARGSHQLQQGGKPRLPNRRATVMGNEARQKRRMDAHQASEAFPRVAGSVQEVLEFFDKQHRQPRLLACLILVYTAWFAQQEFR